MVLHYKHVHSPACRPPPPPAPLPQSLCAPGLVDGAPASLQWPVPENGYVFISAARTGSLAHAGEVQALSIAGLGFSSKEGATLSLLGYFGG